MRAVCLTGHEISFDAEFSPSREFPEFTEVEVLKAGICETDLQLKQGYMGFSGVLGHEFVGIAKSGRFAGRRVVGEINCACGQCRMCAAGKPRHCLNRSVIGILNHDGAFADSVRVPDENLHLVPDDVPTDVAVFTEPVAAACRIPEQINVSDRDRVIIFGDGRLGNLCAQVLKTTGCSLSVVGKHDWKLKRLKDLGIDTCPLADFDFAHDADVAVDCTGSPSGFECALKTVSPCGTIIQKTTVAATQELHLAPIVIDEINILGSRCGPFEPALKLLQTSEVRTENLLTAEYPIERAVDAFAHAESPEALKVLLSVSA